jgi:hypothetical protein
MKTDIDRTSFYDKMTLSVKEDKLTDETWKDILIIIDNELLKSEFKDDSHKQKCKESVLQEISNHWKEFRPNHPNKPDSAFNVIVGLVKNGIRRIK